MNRAGYLESAAIGLALGAMLFSSGAAAQESTAADAGSAADDEIVVTGSLLARSDATSATPITVVGSEQILDSGTLSISDVLRKDPALGSQSRGPGTGLNGAGINAVDLRNLGNQRTLALVNGHRYPKFSDVLGNSGQDITGIPSYLIKQVEVLRDGASTTYGADAVAGVVNFILNDKFDGLQLDAYSGISSRGDGFSYRVSGLIGLASDRGSLVFGAGYQHQDDIPQQNRKWAIPIITGFNAAGAPIYGTTFTPGGRVTAATGIPGSPANSLLACYPVDGGTTNIAPACGTYDGALQTSLYSASTVKSAGAIGRYEVTDNIRLKVDAFYTNRASSQDIAAIQANTGSTLGVYPAGFVIPSTNSNNPYGRDIRLTWRPAQYGPRSTITDSDTLFANFGFDGTVFGDWKWEVTHTYGKTKSTQRTLNQMDSSAFFNLLNPAACAANAVCAAVGPVTNIAALLQQATPLTDAQRDYLLKDVTANISFVSQQTLATLGGTIFELPAGDVGLAIGLEHRSERGSIRPDALLQSGVLVGSQVLETRGKFSTKEVFAELNVPLLADTPFFEELTVNLQGRYSDFSNFGSAGTYKIGVNWSPIEDLRFRGAYGTSFRAPDVLELYSGGSVATSAVQDPCNAAGLRATNTTVNANCNALGVPANFQQPQTALPYRLGGNPELQPEKGRTLTLGAVFTPRFIPGLTLTADYYDVRVRDAIANTDVQNNLNTCYAAGDFATRAATPGDICFGFNDRGPTSALGRLNAIRINSATLRAKGIDMSANYRTRDLLAPGELDLMFRLSYLDSFVSQGIEYQGQYVSGVTGFESHPEWQGSATINYTIGQFGIQWATNFVDRMRDRGFGTSVPVNNSLGYSGTPRYFSHDLLLRVTDVGNTDFAFGINNLFDKDPPYAFVTTRNTLSGVYDIIGRHFYMTVKHRF